jgi:catechol 2,3-dioxygenase-like lactoylglutathione lyase family enzyme
VRGDQRALPGKIAVLDRATQRCRLDQDADLGEIVEVGRTYLDDSESLLGRGLPERSGRRAEGVMRKAPVRPNRLGHAVLGTTNLEASTAFFVSGLGFKVSDHISDKGAFLRCSNEHHNVLVLAAPVNFLHHTSWQVADVDEIGRGATHMLEDHPERHVWGLGRHHAGSNFFWYLKDPAGNFSEYFADMDCDINDQLWKPEVFEGKEGLYSWGLPPPPSFLHPDDLADLMIGSHSASN